MNELKIALAQLNPTMGDIVGNVKLAIKAHKEAVAENVDIIVFSELFLCGYPPEDLILKPSFIAACHKAHNELALATANNKTAIIIGTPYIEGEKIYNSAMMFSGGEAIAVRHKVDLPNYGVFDEKRTFTAGMPSSPINFNGVKLGIAICEDIWGEEDIVETLSESGAELLLVINGSPYEKNIIDKRQQTVIRQVINSGLPIAYINQVGGQDELVFDGASFVINANKSLAVQLPQFTRAVQVTNWHCKNNVWQCVGGEQAKLRGEIEANWCAAKLGLQDYFYKNNFEKIVLGLSGGIDSAVCAALCVDSIGKEKVKCLALPYIYTAQQSKDDAIACAKMLGVELETIDIEKIMESAKSTLPEKITKNSIVQENLQSRIRGLIIMAYSNSENALVITTGNKSELAVGYATLYGDMNGGFNPIKDFYKTEIFALAKWRNQQGEVIPPSIIEKAPSAELRENQKDSDSLPEYEVLDCILKNLIEEEKSVTEIANENNFAIDVVRHVESLLYKSEYKRRQAALGTKISKKSFGKQRRYPITNNFRES